MDEMIQKKLNKMNVVKKSPRLSTGISLEEKFLLVNERIVRVVEELKHQRDILIDLKKDMDRRFEENQKYMDKRFEHIEKRFVFMQWLIMVAFVTLGTLVSVIKIFG